MIMAFLVKTVTATMAICLYILYFAEVVDTCLTSCPEINSAENCPSEPNISRCTPCPACPAEMNSSSCPPCRPEMTIPSCPPCQPEMTLPSCPPEPTCPIFWTKFQNHCYRFFGDRLAWDAAELHCRSIPGVQGAHLVSIHNRDENTFVHDLWQNALITPHDGNVWYTTMWIGLNDNEIENLWVWSDDTPSDYTNWNPGEPNDANSGEDCTTIYRSNEVAVWFDSPCTRLLPFICKMPID